MQKKHIEQIAKIIEQNQKFILTTHANPDGDGIGSEMALYYYLRQIGKQVTILNIDSAPGNLRFLDPDHLITIFDRQAHRRILEQADLVIVLDISDWNRLRDFGKAVLESGKKTVCIDHHILAEKFADHDFVFTSASSTGELMYDLLKGLNAKFETSICEAIFTAIIADTGCFRFSNTSS